MSDEQVNKPATKVSFCSSLADDAWHDLAGLNAFESWHFDAVSDDGREAVVVTFYDNFVLSPRFHSASSRADTNGSSALSQKRFPAVSFVYSIDGRPVLSSVNEFDPSQFKAAAEKPELELGRSSFRVERTEYGTGYMVTVDIDTMRGRRIRAEMEWLTIEADLMPRSDKANSAIWNIAVPRSDVSGKIKLIGRRGSVRKLMQFRGTGYHDHISSENVHYRDLGSRMWGRAHFVDTTVVFDRLGGVQDRKAAGNVFIIRDGRIAEYEAGCEASEHRRDRWGLNVPRRIDFETAGGLRLGVRPVNTVRSGFSDVKMLSEIELDLKDGKTRKTVGLTEFVDPRRMRNPFFRWISDLRIGKRGRSPIL